MGCPQIVQKRLPGCSGWPQGASEFPGVPLFPGRPLPGVLFPLIFIVCKPPQVRLLVLYPPAKEQPMIFYDFTVKPYTAGKCR
jgi:hypothetical protein